MHILPLTARLLLGFRLQLNCEISSELRRLLEVISRCSNDRRSSRFLPHVLFVFVVVWSSLPAEKKRLHTLTVEFAMKMYLRISIFKYQRTQSLNIVSSNLKTVAQGNVMRRSAFDIMFAPYQLSYSLLLRNRKLNI